MLFRKVVPPKMELEELLSQSTNQEACSHYGVTDRTFARWLSIYDISRLRPRKKAPPKKELIKFLKTHTHKDAQIKYGVKESTFLRWLRELNLEDRHFYHDTMKSLAYAAKRLHVSRMALSLWFRQGLIPDARKVNSTRVMIPESSIHYLKRQIEMGLLGGRWHN